MNLCPLAWSALLVLSLMSASASGECLAPSARTLDEPTVELVFGGYVVGITQVAELGVRVTFNVERVWKGSVPKRLDLYIWQQESENPRFEFGGGYIVFARRMTERARQGVGVTDPNVLAFGPIACGALDYRPAESSGSLRQFGEGKPPK